MIISADICPGFDDLNDIDNDSVPKGCDNCPEISNIDQIDFGGDGAGDECDPDIDADGVLNKFDPCPFTALGVAVYGDGRSLGDIDLDCDTDLDDYRLLQLGFSGSSK